MRTSSLCILCTWGLVQRALEALQATPLAQVLRAHKHDAGVGSQTGIAGGPALHEPGSPVALDDRSGTAKDALVSAACVSPREGTGGQIWDQGW